MLLDQGNLNRHVGRQIDVFEGVHETNGFGKSDVVVIRLLQFCNKKNCVRQIVYLDSKEEAKKSYSMGKYMTEIDFVLFGKKNSRYSKNKIALPGNCNIGWS